MRQGRYYSVAFICWLNATYWDYNVYDDFAEAQRHYLKFQDYWVDVVTLGALFVLQRQALFLHNLICSFLYRAFVLLANLVADQVTDPYSPWFSWR